MDLPDRFATQLGEMIEKYVRLCTYFEVVKIHGYEKLQGPKEAMPRLKMV
jgi:hypothetical protein